MREVVVVDTGPLVALLDEGDRWHATVREWLVTTRHEIVVAAPVLAEVCYLAQAYISPPASRNRTAAIGYDRHRYKERNVAERFFARVKQYRRVATRYDKRAANYLGFVWVASLAILLA